MAVRIRLRRTGRRNAPSFRIVVADGTSPRDGRFIEIIGQYYPRLGDKAVQLDTELMNMNQALGDFSAAQTALAAKFRLVRYALNESR